MYANICHPLLSPLLIHNSHSLLPYSSYRIIIAHSEFQRFVITAVDRIVVTPSAMINAQHKKWRLVSMVSMLYRTSMNTYTPVYHIYQQIYPAYKIYQLTHLLKSSSSGHPSCSTKPTSASSPPPSSSLSLSLSL